MYVYVERRKFRGAESIKSLLFRINRFFSFMKTPVLVIYFTWREEVIWGRGNCKPCF